MSSAAARIVHGDARHLDFLDDASVDLIVTSPPYFSLRSYVDGEGRYDGQIGSEGSPEAYLRALWGATKEWWRVLKPTGSLWVNLGDKYAGSGGQWEGDQRPDPHRRRAGKTSTHGEVHGLRAKSLMCLPEAYRLGAIGQFPFTEGQAGPEGQRWIARAVVVWDKPNGLPESITDRVRRSHEDWVHLTREGRYYSALDEIRLPYAQSSLDTYAQRGLPQRPPAIDEVATSRQAHAYLAGGDPENWRGNPLGKLPGSVWSIASEPLQVPEWARRKYNLPPHFAAFPTEWPRRLILGFSPSAICTACGEGRRPVVAKADPVLRRPPTTTYRPQREMGPISGGNPRLGYYVREATILGYACACTPYTDHVGSGEGSGQRHADAVSRYAYVDTGNNDNGRGAKSLQNRPKVGGWREYHFEGWEAPPTRPAVVLDPFGGTGTTAMVAVALGRHGISVDLSRSYCELARWRIEESGHAVKAEQRTWAERQGRLV